MNNRAGPILPLLLFVHFPTLSRRAFLGRPPRFPQSRALFGCLRRMLA
jgi:hypothetical protein